MCNTDDIESQVTDNETRQVLLSVLKARLAKLQPIDAGPEISNPPNPATLDKLTAKNPAEFGEFAERALEPQPFPTEREPSAGERDSLATEQTRLSDSDADET